MRRPGLKTAMTCEGTARKDSEERARGAFLSAFASQQRCESLSLRQVVFSKPTLLLFRVPCAPCPAARSASLPEPLAVGPRESIQSSSRRRRRNTNPVGSRAPWRRKAHCAYCRNSHKNQSSSHPPALVEDHQDQLEST